MSQAQVFSIVDGIVEQGFKLLGQYFRRTFPLDYVAIFARDTREKQAFLETMKPLGTVVEKTPTGLAFKLDKLNDFG